MVQCKKHSMKRIKKSRKAMKRKRKTMKRKRKQTGGFIRGGSTQSFHRRMTGKCHNKAIKGV